MDQEQQKQIAVFRFGVISDFVNGAQLEPGERERLLREKTVREWQIPFSNRTSLSRSTLCQWIRQYQNGGNRLEALCPKERKDQGKSRAIDEETCLSLIKIRAELPKAPVSVLIKEMRDRGIIGPEVELYPATVYRFLHQQGLMHKAASEPPDRRRFEAEFPNDLWQSDVMHGPMVMVEGKGRKTYLVAFLDDMSRMIPYAEFFLHERLDNFLTALRKALLKRGLPKKLYVDNGPAFRAKHLAEILASLGVALIHARPYQPQGKGKCERFFRTVRSQVLSTFTGQTLEQLNEALFSWLDEVYHQRKHSSTGQTPLSRFAGHMECLRPSPKNLEDYFRKRARRRVSKDRTISLNGRLYEAPVPLIGKQVTVLYADHDPGRVEILFRGLSHGFLRPVDLHVNARVRRHHQRYITLEKEEATVEMGGQLWFGRRDDEEEE
jgi:transposase InsO family protein